MKCSIDCAEREHAHLAGIEQLRDEAIDAEFGLMLDKRHTLIRHVVDEFAEKYQLPELFTDDWLDGHISARLLLPEDCVLDKILPEIERRITPTWDDWP